MDSKQRRIAMKNHEKIGNSEQERLAFIVKQEQRYSYLVGKSEEEIKSLPTVAQYKAYDLGFLVSKEYSSEEIEVKKQEYLAMLPLPSSGKSVERWQYEVERQFNRSDFGLYPDKIFLVLDTFRRIGSPC